MNLTSHVLKPRQQLASRKWVWPLDATVFADEDFETSAVTDQPELSNNCSSSMVQSTAVSYAAEIACTVAATSHFLNVMNSPTSSSTGVIPTISLVVGPSNNVDVCV
jgi:hypothetical protein